MANKKLMHVSMLITGVVELEAVEEGVLCHVKGSRLSGQPDFFCTTADVPNTVELQLAVKSILADLLPKLVVQGATEVVSMTPAGNTQPPPEGKQ